MSLLNVSNNTKYYRTVYQKGSFKVDIKIKKINFEGNILKVIKATVTEMRGINNHQKYDFDLYQIEARSPMSTREITLTVDFIKKSIR